MRVRRWRGRLAGSDHLVSWCDALYRREQQLTADDRDGPTLSKFDGDLIGGGELADADVQVWQGQVDSQRATTGWLALFLDR